jgi:circadian clock protein KaiC
MHGDKKKIGAKLPTPVPEEIPMGEEVTEVATQVKPQEYEARKWGYQLAKLGVEGLDERIGGLLRGRSYLVTGETGTGKTLFSLTFLMEGLRTNEPGIYVLVDEEYEDFMNGVYDFGWDLENYIKAGKLRILTLMPDFVEKMRNKPVDTVVMSIVDGILLEARRISAQRLVIDPVAPLIVNEGDITWTREYIKSLIINLEKRIGATTLIVSEVPTGSTALSRFGVEEFLATGVFVLGIERIKNTFYRTLYVRKMRWRPVPPQSFVFDIVKGKGVVVRGELNTLLRP